MKKPLRNFGVVFIEIPLTYISKYAIIFKINSAGKFVASLAVF